MTRKTKKEILALVATTLVVATFVIKEAFTDKLKELRTSLETAQTAFNIEADIRNTSADLGRLMSDFYEYAATPNRPLWKPEQISHPGCHAIYQASSSLYQAKSSLEIVARLAKKLPDNVQAQYDFQEMNREFMAALERLAMPNAVCRTGLLIPNIQNLKLPTDNEVKDLVRQNTAVTTNGYKLSEDVLHAAAEQLDTDEARLRRWSIASYFLYGVSFMIGIIRIFVGGDEDVGSELEEG